MPATPKTSPMTLPEAPGRWRTSFIGNVCRGCPTRMNIKDWPWRGVATRAPTSDQHARIVHFRPFSETTNYPDTLTYLLFGVRERGPRGALSNQDARL